MYLESWLCNPSTSDAVRAPGVLLGNAQLLLKRITDLAGAFFLLWLFSPVFLVVALLIKLSSPGPVFHIRKRVGLNQVPFAMWKFRTMAANAEKLERGLRRRISESGPFFKVKNDRRVFLLGKFLRMYSLDELPQLINVLKGDMSLVGPRPIFDFELQEFDQWKQLRRFSMKPGLTGLWQVNGRSNTSPEQRMGYDLEYVTNWTFLLDLKVLLKTIPAVLKRNGAV